MSVERRDVFRILVAATAAARLPAAERTPKLFSKAEYELLDRACEIILPADADGGGAHDAGVAAYIDTVVSHSDPATKAMWKRSLAALPEDALATTLSQLVAKETAPKTELERFFVRLKALTVEAFFQSNTGFKYVGYKGNGHTFTFPGCTHPEHKTV